MLKEILQECVLVVQTSKDTDKGKEQYLFIYYYSLFKAVFIDYILYVFTLTSYNKEV